MTIQLFSYSKRIKSCVLFALLENVDCYVLSVQNVDVTSDELVISQIMF